MSIKDELNSVKEELSNEEKFLESTIKAEKFIKKYKKLLISSSVFLILLIAYLNINSYLEQKRIEEANILYKKALQNDKFLSELEKKSNALYQIALYELNKPTNNKLLKEIQEYNKAIKNNDIKTLNKLINNKFLLKDFATLQKVIILIKQNKFKEAKNTLVFLKDNKILKKEIVLLQHFLMAKGI